MDSTEKIILNGSLSKSSNNENMSLNTVLSGNKKILPDDNVTNVVNSYNEYLKEREESNKFRLIVNINPFCTNALFNPFTEIIKKNGDEILLLNFVEKSKGLTGVTGTIGKTGNFKWTAYDAIRDTQLSNNACGFEYYCGIDIFNNHILRNKTFKSVNYSSLSNGLIQNYAKVYGEIGYKNRPIQQNSNIEYTYLIEKDFNTIDDYMRDRNGVIVQDIKLSVTDRADKQSKEIRMPLHLYQNYDVYTFENCVKEKLVEKDGWFGFYNPSTVNTVFTSDEGKNDNVVSESFDVKPYSLEIGCDEGDIVKRNITITANSIFGNNEIGYQPFINKTINNRKYSDFVDMYPSRELYSFSPLYNKGQKRYEKNWNYCLTYPSKSIVEEFSEGGNGTLFPFFSRLSDNTVSLKAITFDEYTVDDDGVNVLTIYSICQHGLKAGDNINIYLNEGKDSELVYNNGKVKRIIDKYVFQVYKETYDISKAWINVDEIEWSEEGKATISILNDDGDFVDKTFSYAEEEGVIIDERNVRYNIAASNRCNIDRNAQKISFKRVLNNVECDYYVRVFSRLPNFKFADAEINDYNLYEDKNLNLIYRFSDPSDKKCDFENHISDMSFAQTYYGDKSTEIVYTDDIDVSYLKDNLGRPLSEIFLTIIKNNKGYGEWYTSSNTGGKINDADIEFSHCFGYNSSSFQFNDLYIGADMGIGALKDVREINAEKRFGLYYPQNDNDEIIFDEIRDFYGDICCYCPVECDEQSLGSSMCRFNTVQRELANYNSTNGFDEGFDGASTFFNSIDDKDPDGIMLHDEIIDDESGIVSENDSNLNDLYKSFNEDKSLHHSSFYLDAKGYYEYKNMLKMKEGYYYKMHYRIPLKTVSMSINKDNGITYDLFSIEPTNGILKIKTVNENNLSLNDKLTLYNRTNNKFYYLTVSKIHTKFYFECTVKNEDLSEGFVGEIKQLDDVFLIKRKQGTPEYAKLIKDGSCTYYWRNIISNGIEQNDSKIYPFTNGAFYINRQINFFLRRQDPYKYNLGASTRGQFDYVPDGEFLPDDYYEGQYYNSDEIEIC